MLTEAILMLAGDAPGPWAAQRLRQLWRRPQILTIAVDGGANHLADLGLEPQVVAGDNDSLRPGLFPLAQREQYPQRKNFSDGEAALRYALSRCSGRIYIFGGLGGRLDHHLANLLLPLHAANAPQRILLVGEGCVAGYSCGRYSVVGQDGDILSLIPLTAVHGLTLHGLEYPLCDYDAMPGDSRTLSNRIQAPGGGFSSAGAIHRDGVLLAVHYPAPGGEEQALLSVSPGGTAL